MEKSFSFSFKIFRTYRFLRVKIDVVYRSIVSWQFVQYPTARSIPDVVIPVGGSGGHLTTVRRPCASQKILKINDVFVCKINFCEKTFFIYFYNYSLARKYLFKVMLMPGQYFHAAFVGRERPYVPYLQRVIHSVGENVRSVGTETQSGDGVGVSLQFIEHRVFSEIPHFNVIVDTATDHLFRRIVERYCSHLIVFTKLHVNISYIVIALSTFDRNNKFTQYLICIIQCVTLASLSRIPNTYCAVVAA